MTDDIPPTAPTVDGTTPEQFGQLSPAEQRALRTLRDTEAQWEVKAHDTGPMIERLRDRARLSQRRATIFLWSLIVTVLVGVAYFVAYPVYSSLVEREADEDRRAQLASISQEEVRLAGVFETLKAEAVAAALSIWERDNRLPQLQSIFFTDAQRGWAVGEEGVILSTTDGGAAWEQQPAPDGLALNSVHFADAQRGWAVGEEGVILSTTDGGAAWEQQPAPDGLALNSVHFADAQRGWAVGRDGVILSTTDGGATWDQQPAPDGLALNSVHFADAQRGWAVGWDGVILSTMDGGAVWKQQFAPAGADFLSVYFIDAQRGWAVALDGRILSTKDGGAFWEQQRDPDRQNIWSVHFADAQHGWAVGWAGGILSTTDGGATWERQTAPARATLHSVYFADAQRGWAVGSDGLILSTTDGGAVWERHEAFPRPPAPTAEIDWFGADVQRATTAQELQRALSLSDREIVDTDYLGRISTLLGEQARVAERRAALPSVTLSLEEQALETARQLVAEATDENRSDAMALFDAALRQKAFSQTWWQRLDEQIPLGVLLLFLLATFNSLYRYSTRVAGFYHARADALELLALRRTPDRDKFEQLASTLAAESVEFRMAKTPADMATELTKEVIGKLNLKPGGS